MPRVRFQSISVALHLIVVALLLILTSPRFMSHLPLKPRERFVPLIAPFRPTRVTTQSGGGSNVSPTPATRGAPPPHSYRTFIMPPAQQTPKLPIDTSINFDVPIIAVSDHYGDPYSKFNGPGSFGDKDGGGIGKQPGCCGIGDALPGPGISGRIGQPTKPAQLIYRVEPEFSEEARKAKFQGMVVLMVEIGVDGQPHNIKVVSPAGLGLDQKAIEAVSQWRFKPAERGGKPVASTARVEVFFHLM